MKTLRNLTLLIFGLGIILTSCQKDDGPGGTVGDPSITLLKGSDATVTAGSTVTVAWDARKNPNGSNLETFTITRDDIAISGTTYAGNAIPYTIASADAAQYVDTIDLTAPQNAGTYVYRFKVTDKEGKVADKSISITVEAVTAINTFSQKLLGAKSNAAGSALSASTGNVHSVNPANTPADTQKTIDIIYAYHNTQSILGAPSDSKISDAYPTNMTGWTNKNQTFFKSSSLTKTDFDGITTGNEIKSLFTSSTKTAVTNVSVLSSGSVFLFKTSAGKYGILHVADVQAGDTGSITLDVKVEE